MSRSGGGGRGARGGVVFLAVGGRKLWGPPGGVGGRGEDGSPARSGCATLARRCHMLFLRLVLFVVSLGFLALAVGIVLYDVYLAFELNRILRFGGGAADE